MKKERISAFLLAFLFLGVTALSGVAGEQSEPKERIVLRVGAGGGAGGGAVPISSNSVVEIATLKILAAFEKKFPHIRPISASGISIPGGSRTLDMVPLMQIAGDIAADAMFVNFRQSDTYVRNKFLYPLDKYIEEMLELDIKDGANMELDDYLKELKKSPKFETLIAPRVPRQTWKIMRRVSPYGVESPFAKSNGGELDFDPKKKSYHIWAFPEGVLVMALFYRKDMFQEAGLPLRVPETLDQMYEYAKILHKPSKKQYGMRFGRTVLSWSTLSILYSYGGLLVDNKVSPKNPNGDWICVFDSTEAVDAYCFVAKLFHKPFKSRDGKEYSTPVFLEDVAADMKFGMSFAYINEQSFADIDPSISGFGPVPMGPTGMRGSEFNCTMLGIYAGLDGEENKARRDAAWEYIKFYNGREARIIRTKVFVENGMARFVQPRLLKEAGFEDFIRQIPAGWEKAYNQALKNGIPEPYGKNCQLVYDYASRAVDQIRTDDAIEAAVVSGDNEKLRELVKGILEAQVASTNAKMLDILDPKERKKRNTVAAGVAVAIMVLFVLLFRKVFKTFDAAQEAEGGGAKGRWQFGRYKWAYIMLIIPVGSIVLWQYYPLVRGSVMAFQDYNVRGFSEWIGMANFASALYDNEFWFSMWVTLKYALFFGLFGFTAPIVLAFLLTEVPTGKIFFRTLYYLPAVLTGLLVIYLWKGFYSPDGMLNQLINNVIHSINWIFHSGIKDYSGNWLEEPKLALFCILLPVIWGGWARGV